MKNSNLKRRILLDIENLISRSCSFKETSSNYNKLHVALLKKHYNAVDVIIDYHRNRVNMNIIVDDKQYNPKTVNTNLSTIYTNLFFKNLNKFLLSCIDKDTKSIAFYSSLLRSFTQKEEVLITV